jgi:tetratricopeptide (TPR) repeat protein
VKRIDTCIHYGTSYLNARQYDDAIHQFSTALQFVPSHARLRALRSKAYMYQGRYEESSREAAYVIRDLRSEDADAYFALGVSQYHLGTELSTVMEQVRRSVLLDPEHPDAKKFLTVCHVC